MKLLYFHVPKTAGSSLNKFFADHIPKHHFHIESKQDIDQTFCDKYDFLSGHVTYNKMTQLLELKDWITFATFREPLSYTISHLKWVRKLADEGEEERLRGHTETIQKIALKMKGFDFSKPSQITEFIQWLEEIDVLYFHNTQTIHMHHVKNSKNITDMQMETAINHLRSIDFIGIQENLDEFMEMISYEFGWEVENKPRVNVNENNYGFDINDPETKQALLPLYEKDLILYVEAKKLFETQKSLYKNQATSNIIGHIDRMNTDEIVGWARSKDGLQKVDLELQVNGKTLQVTTANLFRQGLKSKGIHPSGLCAFKFDFNALMHDTDHLHIKVAETEIELPKPQIKKKERCILHVGMHKTGSSSLQYNLFNFLDDPDYLYLDLGTPNHSIPIFSLFTEYPEKYYVHKRHGLTPEEIKKYNLTTVQKFLNSFESSTAENVIISGEDISVLTYNKIKGLKVFLDNFFEQIEIIVYIRPPHSYMISSFQQRINGGQQKNFDLSMEYPQYKKKIEKFDDIFGQNLVTIRDFTPSKLYKEDIVLDFCHHYKIDFDEKKLTRTNESIRVETLALLYVYYKFGSGFGTGKDVIVDNSVLRRLLDDIFGKTKISFSPTATNAIIKENNDDIEWVNTRSGFNYTQSYSETAEQNTIQTEQDILDIAMSLYDQVKDLLDQEFLDSVEKEDDKLINLSNIIHALKLKFKAQKKES